MARRIRTIGGCMSVQAGANTIVQLRTRGCAVCWGCRDEFRLVGGCHNNQCKRGSRTFCSQCGGLHAQKRVPCIQRVPSTLFVICFIHSTNVMPALAHARHLMLSCRFCVKCTHTDAPCCSTECGTWTDRIWPSARAQAVLCKRCQGVL